jgi:sarcosine reductase
MQYTPIAGEPVFYGGGVEGMVPTILHPNEVFDGAVLNPHRGPLLETYVIQNQSIIKELYKRHTKDLEFVGVIMTTAHNNPAESERTANVTAKLAKWVLDADGVVITKAGGGAPEVAMSQMALQCEALNIKTAIAMMQMTSDAIDQASETNVMFDSKELDAIVSLGDIWKTPLELPSMKNILGTPFDANGYSSVGDKHMRTPRWIKGILSPMGISKITASCY